MAIEYVQARKQGMKEVSQAEKSHQNPHPAVLSDMVNIDALAKKDLEVIEIPTEMILGTAAHLRAESFSRSFYPLADEDSEFAMKWTSLLAYQYEDGIREPVKVYEYMHRFFVIEGNKRVSVMKFLEMPVMDARVIRVLPKGKEEVYEEFCRFFACTHMYDIDFTIPGEYARLARVLDRNLEERWPLEFVNRVKGGLFRFARVYHLNPEHHLSVSDAYLRYLEMYGAESLLDYRLSTIEDRVAELEERLDQKREKVWRILVISDEEDPGLWDYWNPEKTRDIDLILAAGDLKAEYLEFLATMANKPVVYVPGNHDTKEPLGCISVDGDTYIWNERLRIAGAGGSLKYREGENMYTEKEMRKRLKKLERKIRKMNGVDIFLTHAPALGHGDLEDLPHLGFACFNDFLEKYHPKYMVYGHVHGAYARMARVRVHPSGTVLVNASGKYVIEIAKDDLKPVKKRWSFFPHDR